MSDQVEKTHFRACHLCEAICGLEIKTQGDRIVSIKGDKDDPVSKGFICPKATALEDLHFDPDRLRQPVKKVAREGGEIEWVEISWDEAIEETATKIVEIQKRHGDNAVGFYAGNPGVHNYGNLTHGSLLRRATRTKNHFSATSLDQLPHHLAAYTMYGHQFFLPVPDVDNTDFFLLIGGNPVASNSSMMTMPDAPGRLKAIQKRGGRFIIIDPRKTETAKIASEHHFIKPGTDIYLLLSIINVLFTRDLISAEAWVQSLEGLNVLREAVSPFTTTLASERTGISASVIESLAAELAKTDRAVCHGRMGVSVQEHGALCQWAIQVINILIGALDAEGGARLTSPAFASVRPGAKGGGHFNRFQSRVSGLPEFAGEFPVVSLAEEILTPGDGQIRAMITIAGNPLVSSANAGELEKAFDSLEFYVAFDFYINATTCKADIILPPTSPLEHEHYDIAFLRLAVRNSARFNPAIFEPSPESLHDWEIYNRLSAAIAELREEEFKPLPDPAIMIELGINNDMLGESENPGQGLTLEKIKQYPHGIDLGPLESGLLDRVCHDDGRINLVPDLYLDAIPSLLDHKQNTALSEDELLLIGRRHVRSNNSWMHNYHRLVKGKPRWQLQMHPDDLESLSLSDGDAVTVRSRVGEITTVVESTDEMMPGVVSLPHGWGHDKAGVQMSIASKQKGVNCNALTDDKFFDKLSGNAALNGVPVTISAV